VLGVVTIVVVIIVTVIVAMGIVLVNVNVTIMVGRSADRSGGGQTRCYRTVALQ